MSSNSAIATTGVQKKLESKLNIKNNNSSSVQLPTPLETWEHQQRVKQDQQGHFGGTRRILPLPTSTRRREILESDTARNVRLLLARHQGQDQSQQRHQKVNMIGGQQLQRPKANYQQVPDQNSDTSDQFSSAILPGDSYPEVGKQLLSLEDEASAEDTLDEEDDEDLIRRLNQSQARMEQIKRMLVTQRGFIVQALKQLAENKNNAQCETCSSQVIDLEERDRTLGSTLKRSAEQRLKVKNNESVQLQLDSRVCPMCEAVFPADVDSETFEHHVVGHFEFEEPETIKYIGSDPDS